MCRDNDINVPIIPGIKPIATKNQLTVLPQRFFLNLPEKLVNQIIKCKTNKEVREVGIKWAIQQCKELIEFGAPCLHFYTMGSSDNVHKIVSSLA